jgi:pantetheine-phosphate adenylyltransferase
MNQHICFGGTFDNLHLGHKKLIKTAFENGKKVTIGLTSDNMLSSKKYKQFIEPYDKRKANLINFISQSGWKNDFRIISLDSVYGSTLKDKTLDAIVVSPETVKNAKIINHKRLEQGLKPLKIKLINFVKSQDHKILRSEKVRAGLINSNGESYYRFLAQKKIHIIPPHLRPVLREPFGKVFKTKDFNISKDIKRVIKQIKKDNPLLVISVGDVVTTNLINNDFKPHICIIDRKTKRLPFKTDLDATLKARNPSGTIWLSAITKLRTLITNSVLQVASNNSVVLEIIGEEDLMVLPAIMLSPLKTVILYGQADFGIIYCLVDIELKERALKILNLQPKPFNL